MNRKPRKLPSTEENDRVLLGALLRRCHQMLMGEINRALMEAGYAGVQPAHTAVLRALCGRTGGLRSTELAASAGITKQSMGAVIDQLERLGYVERIPDPNDKRAKLVQPTKRGREVSRMARAAGRRVESDWERRVGVTRIAVLRETLTLLLASPDIDA